MRLKGEQAVIMGYITQKVDALIQGPDATNPQHLDLTDVSKILAASNAAAEKGRKGGEKHLPEEPNRLDLADHLARRGHPR